MVPEPTGRPAYHPAVLLKIYLYGYLNQVQSSRRLERETQRNIDLMWLVGCLAPDFKTIADFRKDNGEAIRAVELPIRSPLDERTREGDDHPARLFLRFITDHGEKRAMEVIWGNRLKPGDYKYIGGFPHFVADAGDDRLGQWLDERIDLARVYAEIWKDAAPAHLVDIAVFCDSNDTHTASISYFAYVRLERR